MATRKKIIYAASTYEGVVFGIVTQLRDYQLCWHLNKTLKIEMKMMDDLEITHKKKNKTALFSWFKYEDELDKWRMYLVSNKHYGEHFIPEMKQPDFIFMIQGEISSERCHEFLSIIKQINAVQLVVEIDPTKIKSKENLMLE